MKYIYQINNFNKIKNKLVKLLEEASFTNLENNIEKISKTDFHISKDINRKYVSFLQDEILNNFSKKFCIDNNFKSLTIENIWFQIYKSGDFHALHTHLNTNFTNIIYVSLPNKKIKTNVYSLQREKEYIDVKVGDILTFPAFLPHESPINTCKKDKIIVSFNSSGNIIV